MPGTIEKRGANTWRITISDGFDSDGSRRYVRETVKFDSSMSESAQHKECEKRKAILYTQTATGAAVASKQYTFAEFAKLWMQDYPPAKKLSQVTVENYRYLLNSRILPELGHIKLSQITPHRLTQFYNKLGTEPGRGNRGQGKPLSSKTVIEHHRLIRVMLGTARRWGMLAKNPADDATPPRLEQKKMVALTDVQSRDLLLALEQEPLNHRVAVMLALLGQLRKGEIGGLNWGDVDFEGQWLHVEREAVYTSATGVIIKATKTDAGRRTISLPDGVLSFLRKLRAQQAQERLKLGELWEDSGAMFTTWNGARQHPDTISKWFRGFLKRHELPAMRFHDLRHTGASLLIASGMDIETVKDRLGHTQASTTMNVYGHGYKENDARAAGILGNMLMGEQG